LRRGKRNLPGKKEPAHSCERKGSGKTGEKIVAFFLGRGEASARPVLLFKRKERGKGARPFLKQTAALGKKKNKKKKASPGKKSVVLTSPEKRKRKKMRRLFGDRG